MRVCLVSVEIFAWGKYGGFGRATRIIGRELARRGVDVYAVVPRRQGQKPIESLDGITVLSFPAWRPISMGCLFRDCDADIYHSQHPSFGTYMAQRVMPDRKHIATFRDPKLFSDWRLEFHNPSRNRLQVAVNWLYEDGLLPRSAIDRLDGAFCAAECLNDILREKYAFSQRLETLPTPVAMNPSIDKASSPTVCYVGRWDRRKRPELFFELATKFPRVEFIAVGQSRDPNWEQELRRRYSGIRNLRLLGFVDQFRSHTLTAILSKSWILANTSVREGLPTAYLEALASQCAILSHTNPDDVAGRFGYHAAADDFAEGLDALLKDDAWRERGRAGYRYVQENYELQSVIDKHVAVYERLLHEGRRSARPG